MKHFFVFICALFVFGIAHAAQCPAGTYSTDGDATECVPCPIDTYANAGENPWDPPATECTKCPDGFHTDGTGSTGISACIGEFERPWTGHQVCDVPSGCVNSICEPCEIKPCKYVAGLYLEYPWDPPKEYVISGCETNDANCTAPIRGTISKPGWGAIGVQRCERCAAGTYSPGGENAVCTKCPANIHVSPAGATDITDCGRILKYQKPGDDAPTEIFLNGIRNTSPSFNVKIGNNILYANMTPVADTTKSGMYVKYNNQSYIVTSSRVIVDNHIFNIITMPDTTEFSMQISAPGKFTIDWGDGNVEDIVRNDKNIETYSHTYANAGSYIIGIDGVADGQYNAKQELEMGIPVINFNIGNTSKHISGIFGSLGKIFPTIGDGGAGNQPLFTGTFSGATNLTEIPVELFDEIHGTPAPQMFTNTFYGCSRLSGQSARVAGVPLYEWIKDRYGNYDTYCEGEFPWDDPYCNTYTGATGLLDYDEIPAVFK